jgi:hypothetical protein
MTEKMTDAEWEKLKEGLLLWLKECDYGEEANKTIPTGSIIALIKYCESLREAQRWRSVEDEPPENATKVLVCENYHIGTGFYSKGQWGFGAVNPSHWMPLPAPQEES